VVAFAVQQRTREFGIRLALGAEAGRVRRMVLGQAAVLVAGGGVIGLVGALLAGRAVESLLFGVTAFDVSSFVAATAILGVAVLAAAWWPARRASRVNPSIALTGRV
jgi:ABC-type antimicrobial peptide transport system permease subunit